jgi:5-methylcytosine-specific restriction endonuclease McrBC GTP-binding regulatory subunit McrB
MKIIIKKVPKNEVDSGTEIALLIKYFNDGLIDDPKNMTDIDETEGSKSYPIKVNFEEKVYTYAIKAYKTKDYGKDRRLIINANDPLSIKRKDGDYMCCIFDKKITKNSMVEIKIVRQTDELEKVISSLYKNSNGLVVDEINDSVLFKQIKILNIKHPLNQILFGPPGTGKTDSTVEKALEILEMSSAETDDQKRREENREIFRSLLNKKIFFVTMHPSYSYEDFVQGIKPKTSDKGELLFEPKPGIFKVVSDLAETNYKVKKISQNQSEVIDFDFVFNYSFRPLLEDGEPVIIQRGDNDFKIIAINDRTLKFETSTGNTGPTYNLSRITIKKIFEKGVNDIILSGNKGYFDGIQDFLTNKRNDLVEVYGKKTIENNNYVLILDEINRANISKVFGELITLLEEDKRMGNENELSVTLPSGEIFSVPPNLYIIGTMNTADKSIALVDIALRRRFQFIPVYPDSTIITKYCKCTDKADKALFMDSLNTRLRTEKGVDFQIGHAYFLKDNSLADVINENVIPLLTEYFRNDLEKVKSLISDIGKPLDDTYYNQTGLLKY